MKNILIFYVLTFVLIFNISLSHAGWLVYHKPEFKGKVIDTETKQPIEGAVVVAIYKKHTLISGPGGGHSSIIKIKETLTDEKGEFDFPSYTTVIQPLSEEDYVEFIIYKPGYGTFPGLQTSPPLSMRGKFFSKEYGTSATIQIDHKTIKYTMGLVELPKLKTWDERRKANRISISDIHERKWPLLNKAIKKENEWLKRHKGWRMESE